MAADLREPCLRRLRERLLDYRRVDLGLAGKACVVTGASRGIGRETARLLCAEGAQVLLVARSEQDRSRLAAEECGRAGAHAAAARPPSPAT